MRSTIKAAAHAILGPERVASLLRRTGLRKRYFSELEAVLAFFRKSSQPRVMIDVGSHFGESAEPFLKMGWNVIAFEPDPANRSALEKRVGSFPNLKVLPLACSDKEQVGVPFFSSPESDGISSLSAFRCTHSETARVDITTLKCALAAFDLPKVDFLKIDAEGHDLFVLRGFPWEKFTPQVVVCEYEDKKTLPLGYSHSDLGEFLRSKGYTVFASEWHPIVRYGTQHQWRGLVEDPAAALDPEGWGNFVALRSDVNSQFLKDYAESFE
jgi:FkbM family methyltransferase